MSVEDRIAALKAKHHELETALEQENHRPHPDDEAIHDIKRQKLKIKDEIAQLA
ncbi:YdcH family protein [Magnetospira sp. QH-2]|uniref:YdcH family protein n=1 Tax=Magnetospira sp. (strain QH-2) TaxID=1288970 RepID=UPI0009E57581|nr:YdcH family protein [Magnetospira sp. QH-2]